jgi:hypothetical protein
MDIMNLDYLHLFNLAKDQAMTIDKDIIFAFSVGTLIGSAIIALSIHTSPQTIWRRLNLDGSSLL